MTAYLLTKSAVLASFFSASLTPILASSAHRFRLVDYPHGRKSHSYPTPLVGGIAILFSLALTHFLAGKLFGESASMIAAVVVVTVIGMADDSREISYRSKFVAQFIAALIITSGTDIHVKHLGDIFATGDLILDKWSFLVTVVSIIGLMNAINMIDGMDGLAGTQVLLATIIFAFVGVSGGDYRLAAELAALAGAIGGFLLFNLRSPWMKNAKVFMGDTGGMLLGLFVAWYAIQLGGTHVSPLRPITAVWILAVPLLDMGAVMLLRVVQHKSPFAGDRQHLHYLLLDAGCSVNRVVAILAAMAGLFAFAGLQAEAHHIPETWMFFAFITILMVYTAVLAHPAAVGRWVAPLAAGAETPNA